MATVEIRFSPKDSQWFADNAALVLKAGEPAYCNEAPNYGQYKIGDGVTVLSDLDFIAGGGGSSVWGGITGNIADQTDLVNFIRADKTYSPSQSTAFEFTLNQTMGAFDAPLSGNTTIANESSSVNGAINILIHQDSSPPNLPSGFLRIEGSYVNGAINIIHAQCIVPADGLNNNTYIYKIYQPL